MDQASQRFLLGAGPVGLTAAAVAAAASASAAIEAFLVQVVYAFRQHVGVRPRAYLTLWGHGDDISVLGAEGGHVEGIRHVRDHQLAASSTLDWGQLSTRRLPSFVTDDLAVTVMLETICRPKGDPTARSLRATQAYRRRHDGWRSTLRHAIPMTAEDEQYGSMLLARGASL